VTRRGPGEGSIFKRESDGRWVGTLNLGFDGNGKRQRRTYYGQTQREVREKLEDAKKRARDGVALLSQSPTVRELLDQFVSGKASDWAPGTHRRNAGIVRTHLDPALGRHRLDKLSPMHVKAMLDAKLADGLSPKTVQLIRGLLVSALRQAEEWGLVGRNVARLVPGPRMRRREVEPLSGQESAKLLEHVQGQEHETLFTLAISLGMRQGEILGLRWKDVDLDEATLGVRRTLHKVDGRYELRDPKTEKSRRSLLIPPFVLASIKHHRVEQLERRMRAGGDENEWDLVFTDHAGQPLHGPTVTRRLQALMKRHEMRRIRFHDLRHSCASLLLAQGVPLTSIQEVLGHANFYITRDTYSHIGVELKREAADAMQKALGGS
jgi:integrase